MSAALRYAARGRHALTKTVAKAARGLSRVSGAGAGSSLPGLLVERLDPGFIEFAAGRLEGGVIAVSGTNGKTTTASMIRSILRRAGTPTVGNESGANLTRGIATALVDAADRSGVGVFEVDEAALVRVAPLIRPKVVVLTNIFRDQLDRFGEAESVAALLKSSVELLPERSRVVANCDDSLLWHSVEDRAPIGFGVVGLEQDENVTAEAEPETCPECGGTVLYEARTMAHLGAVTCLRCGWRSATPLYLAEVIAQRGLEGIDIRVDGHLARLHVGGVHNAYNAVAAIAATSALGLAVEDVLTALEGFQSRFGRGEHLLVDGRDVRLLLMKNPAGAGAVIREAASDARVGAAVVAVNDLSADGKDISWIWDADFERLAKLGIPLVPSGLRAHDVAVRLKYAGAKPAPAETNPLAAATRALSLCAPDRLPIVLATYTAMLALRRIIGERGYVRPFWEAAA
jgi:UDP-N-acetylmuramyl tripeptide synthase